MGMQSAPGRRGQWFASALAVGALLIFAGGGAWGYQQMQEQKARDAMRTARLIACLDAAHDAVDGSAARTACRHKYADRVPALLRNNPSTFEVPATTASAAPLLDAMNAAEAPAWRPTPSPSRATETAGRPAPGPSQGDSQVPSQSGNKPAAQTAHPPVAKGKTEQPPGTKNSATAHRPKSNKGKHVGGGHAAAKPRPKNPASQPVAPPRTGTSPAEP